MANRRMLAATVSVCEQLAALETDFARLLFTWMIAHADDYGVLPGSPAKVRALVVPMLNVTTAQVLDALADIEANELIWRYECTDGAPYIQFRTWEKHQSGLHKRTAPRLPRWCDLPGNSGDGDVAGQPFPEVPGSSRKFPVKGKEKGTEENGTEREEKQQAMVEVVSLPREDGPPPSPAAAASSELAAIAAATDPHPPQGSADIGALTAQVAAELDVSKADLGTLQRIVAKHRLRGLSGDDILLEAGKLVARARASPNGTAKKRRGVDTVTVSELDSWLGKARIFGPVKAEESGVRSYAPTGTDGAGAARAGPGASQPANASGRRRASWEPDPRANEGYEHLFYRPKSAGKPATLDGAAGGTDAPGG